MGSRVHLINPSHVSFGVAVITPRWLYVLAAATGIAVGRSQRRRRDAGDASTRPTIEAGDVVGIGIHTGNARRGYEIGRIARERGAWVVYGGIHATLFPDEAHEYGACACRRPRRRRPGLAVGGCRLLRRAAVARLRGRPHRGRAVSAGALGSAAGRTLHVGLGADRARLSEALLVLLGLADRRPGAAAARGESASCARSSSCAGSGSGSSRSPTTISIRSRFDDLAAARRRSDPTRLHELEAMRQERFDLMAQLAAAARRSRVLHADHDGSGGRPRVPRGDAAGAHPRRAGRRRSRSPPRD